MTTPSPLNTASANVLASRDMYALPTIPDTMAAVYGSDGDYLFEVPADIHPSELLQLIQYGEQMYKRGRDAGQDAFAAAIRNLIGAATAPGR